MALGSTIYLFVFIHFLSVRMAIFGVYIALFSFAIFYRRILWKYKKISLILISVLAISVFLLLQIPTLKTKIGYMQYDWLQMKVQHIANYSDGERLQSIQQGIALIKKNPWMGVGEGDLKNEMTSIHSASSIHIKMPHNQFVWTWASSGVIGFIIWIVLYVVLYRLSIRKNHVVLFAYTSVLLCSMLIESTVETQIGALIFVLPLSFLYNNPSVFKIR
jgi:O-antigen ligase